MGHSRSHDSDHDSNHDAERGSRDRDDRMGAQGRGAGQYDQDQYGGHRSQPEQYGGGTGGRQQGGQNRDSQPYGAQSRGGQQHGSQGYGSQGYGSQGYGSQSSGSMYGERADDRMDHDRAGYGRRAQDPTGTGRMAGGYDRGGRGYGGDGDRGFLERAGDEVSSWFGDDDARQRREGDHRGKGPKGYTRSDDRIREEVSDRLSDDPMIDASDIEVQVSEGEVTLSGEVDSRQTKRRAEDCADACAGVRHVQNNLRVRSQTGQSSSASGMTGSSGASGMTGSSGGGARSSSA